MYTTQGRSARKFVIVTMIEPILPLILVHLLSPLWKYGRNEKTREIKAKSGRM